MNIKQKDKDRFQEKYTINHETGCWEWSESRGQRGYGRLKVDGRNERAHRASFEIHIGPIPDGLIVCHKCDVRHCVNPEHLFLGTHQDNTDDKIKKGRECYAGQIGETNPRAVLNKAKVTAIIDLIADGESNKSIASRYGVSHATVSLIRRGKIWTDVPRPEDHPAFERYAALRAYKEAS